MSSPYFFTRNNLWGQFRLQTVKKKLSWLRFLHLDLTVTSKMCFSRKMIKKTGENANEEEVSSGTGKGINQDSFKLGELTLSDKDVARISRRFGIV